MVIKGGTYDPLVLRMQTVLVKQGYLDEADGYYGVHTYEALNQYKVDNNLKTDQEAMNKLLGIGQKISFLPILFSLIFKGKLPMFNGEQIAGILRLGLGIVSTWAIAKGFGDVGLWGDITAGIVLIGTGVWSWFSHKPGTVVPTTAALTAAKDATKVEVAKETIAEVAKK